MTETKFTPGPWFVYRCSYVDGGAACGITTVPNLSECDSTYCDILQDKSTDECHHVMDEADAALIAAAPELYKVLDRIVWAVRGGHPFDVDDAYTALRHARGD